MIGETTGRTYRLGEPVRIRVAGTDRFTKTIDFDFAEDWQDGQGSTETGGE